MQICYRKNTVGGKKGHLFKMYPKRANNPRRKGAQHRIVEVNQILDDNDTLKHRYIVDMFMITNREEINYYRSKSFNRELEEKAVVPHYKTIKINMTFLKMELDIRVAYSAISRQNYDGYTRGVNNIK